MKKTLLLFLLLPFLGFSQVIPAGTYVIGSSEPAPYKTLVTAIARINTSGISGPVTFLLDENQTVTSQITINQFTGSSATNTLTIKPNVGKDITIFGKIDNGAVIALNGTDNIIIDGNNTVSDNKLKIYNNFDTPNSYTNRLGVWLYNGAENNKFQNLTVQLNILGITVGTYSVGIYSGGNSIGSIGNNSNNYILNTIFTDVKQAIIVNGSSIVNKNWVLKNNTIGSSSNNNKPFLGIYIFNVSDYEVSANNIDGVRIPNGLGGSTSHSGIYLENANGGVIEKNVVSNVESYINNGVGYGIYIKGNDNQVNHNSVKNLNSNSTNDGSYGIRVEGNNTTIYKNDIANIFSSQAKNTNGLYISGNNQLVYNNFINDVKSAGGGGTDSENGFGIYINNGSLVKLYYNTVVLKTNQNAGVSAALYIRGGSKLDVRNNIFYNAQTSNTYQRFAIYSEVTNSTSFDFLDYNDYYSTQHVGSWGNYYTQSNRMTTIANWRTATGKDVNSINFLPAFLSATDLHLQNVVGNDPLKAATSITGITTDIDNEARAISPDKPYMGADERCALPNPAGTISGTATVCPGQTNVPYTVPAITNATTYLWSYSGLGATIINSSTRTPTITFAANATSGNLTVLGVNACGNGVISANYAVTVNLIQTTPTIGTRTQPTCSSPTGSVVLNNLPAGQWSVTRMPGNVTTTGSGTSRTITGLDPGTYTFMVTDLGKGLQGAYYNNVNLSGSPVLVRTDATVDSDYGTGSPDLAVNVDDFSVRWTGTVQPLYTETYTFRTTSDDGVRLWVNGVLIINNWTVHSSTVDVGTINLVAGTKYNIVLEYYERGGGAIARLGWSSPSQAQEIIPQSRLDPPAVCSSVASSNVVINAVPATPLAPTVGTRTQPTCTVSTGSVVLNGLPSTTWVLTRIPGNIITTGTGTTTTISNLVTGTYTFAIDNLSNGLKAEYFNNRTLSGEPTLTRNDAVVDYNWGNGSPSPSINTDNFSVRWSGFVQPLYSETYTFRTNSDDGIRLRVNGVQIVDNWTDHGPTIDTGTITLVAGTRYNIVLEYYENGGGAVAQLSWSSPSQALQIIQQSQLFGAALCGNNTSANVVIDPQPIPGAPTLGAISQPTCAVPTGSVALSGLPSSGSWTITTSPATSGITGLTGSGTTATISGLAQGTSYTFTVYNGTCASVSTASVLIGSLVTTTFNGSTWSSGTGIDKIGVVTALSTMPISLSSNTELCNCTVSANTNVVVNSGITLKLQDRLTVNGSLTFEDKSSLIQINDAAVNTGNIIYKRITNTGVRNTDYTYWSTPVSPLNLGGTGGILYNPSSLVGSIFYSYEVTAGYEDWKSESAASPMIIGKGYSIRGPGPISANPLTLLQATFTGTPNNGRYPITGIHPDKAYLIGNPYPSALDANKFLTDNAGVIDGTIYFWTHSTKIGIGVPNPGTGVYAYTGNDYASYNLTGGTGTDGVPYPQGGVEAPNSPGVKPNGYIGAGQGFFAISNTAILGVNEIVFNNSMRVGVGGITGDNSQFFKTHSTKSKTTSTIEKNRVWLNMTSTQGAFKQLLVGYIAGATNDYDNGYDGETFDGNEFIDFYSINQDKNFVIQGRSLPFDSNDEVPLGYRSAAAGDFSISIDEVDGLLVGQNIYLEDKLNNSIHNLTKEAYTFETSKGTFDDRFVLRYTDKTLGTGDFDTTNTQVLVSVKNKQIKINSSVESIDKVLIFDILGKQIFSKINVGATELVIPNLGSSEQVLIIKTLLQNGQTVTTKLIY